MKWLRNGQGRRWGGDDACRSWSVWVPAGAGATPAPPPVLDPDNDVDTDVEADGDAGVGVEAGAEAGAGAGTATSKRVDPGTAAASPLCVRCATLGAGA